MDYPLHFSSQLRQHLRALRKERGLTQVDLGRLLGVGQARIAEIESNPGVVSVDQLMKVLSALRATLILHDDAQASRHEGGPAASLSAPTTVLTTHADAKSSHDEQALREPNPRMDVRSPSRRNYIIRPKKGSW